MTERDDLPSLPSRKQRITIVSLYFLQDLTTDVGVWSHDIHRWQTEMDPGTAVAQPSMLASLNRFEELGLVEALWERYDAVVRRPPRKYHRLTATGELTAVYALQDLRADPQAPTWTPIPELGDPVPPPLPPGFEFTPHEGTLVPTGD